MPLPSPLSSNLPILLVSWLSWTNRALRLTLPLPSLHLRSSLVREGHQPRPPSTILPGRLRPTTAMEFTFSGEHHKVVLGSGNYREREKERERGIDRRRDGHRGREGGRVPPLPGPSAPTPLLSFPSQALPSSLVGWLAGGFAPAGHTTWGARPAGR